MLLSMVGIVVMIIWMVSLISQIRLRKAIVKQGKKAEDVLSYIALISFGIIIILQLVSDYLTGGIIQMSYNLVCPVICLILYMSFKLVTKRKFVKLEEMDIDPYSKK